MTYELGKFGLAVRATAFGVAGLALAVEGGAAIGHDIPGVVIEADAGTGIPGVSITPKCPPNSQPGVRVVVNEVGKSYTFSFTDLTDGHTGSQNIPYGESGGFNAAIGHTVRTAYSGGSETDTQAVNCAIDTTVAPTTVRPTTIPPTTAAPGTTTPNSIPGGEHGTSPDSTPSSTAPATTAAPGTTTPNSIPGGEHGTAPAVNGTSTTAPAGEGSPGTSGASPENLSGNGSTANKAEPGSGLAQTGSDSETPVRGAIALLGLGGLFAIIARRRRKADE